MTTIYEVSKLAGVSLSTVSRVTTSNARVSEKTRQKVLDAMQQLNYQPNSIAQSLASNRSNSVGVLVSEIHGPFFGQMMAGIESELRAAGKHVIITTGHSEEEAEKDGIQFLLSRKCDAIIIHVEAVSDEYLLELSQQSTPFYLVSRNVKELQQHCIRLDNELGGYIATKTLLESGHTDIAYIAGPQFKADASDRLSGHKRALAEHNLPFNESLFYIGDFKEASGATALGYFLDSRIPFSAIVAANDEMASGVMKRAREKGYSLPDDFSLIGFDNVNFTSYLYPQLTTVDNPVNKMGEMAAKLVLRDVYNHKDIDIKHAFKPALISRESIKPRS